MSESETYMFMSQPRAVDATRKKYREQPEGELNDTTNMMFDPRVIRGITCVGPAGNKNTEEEKTGEDYTYQTTVSKEQLIKAGKIRPKFDSVKTIHENIVVPKVRVEVPLHLYLIEQGEETMVIDQGEQTDAFLEEKPQPAYIPMKTGVDAETQVENEVVFDYDVDVMPILEVVISKTVEQSLMEVLQEEELRTVARKGEVLQGKARVRKEEAQKLVNKEREALRKKEQMLLECRQRHKREMNVQQKLASNIFSARYLENLQETVFTELENCNYFYDQTRVNSDRFLPHLLNKLEHNLEKVADATQETDSLIKRVIDKLNDDKKILREAKAAAAAAKQAQIEKAAREAKEAEEKAKILQLYIHAEVVNEPIGPIELTAGSTVLDVKTKIHEWMQENMDAPPSLNSVSFMYEGNALTDESVLYNLGVQALGTIQMIVEDTTIEEPAE